MIFFGEKSLRHAIGESLNHGHRKRNHQGLDNQLLDVGEEVEDEVVAVLTDAAVVVRSEQLQIVAVASMRIPSGDMVTA